VGTRPRLTGIARPTVANQLVLVRSEEFELIVRERSVVANQCERRLVRVIGRGPESVAHRPSPRIGAPAQLHAATPEFDEYANAKMEVIAQRYLHRLGADFRDQLSHLPTLENTFAGSFHAVAQPRVQETRSVQKDGDAYHNQSQPRAKSRNPAQGHFTGSDESGRAA
jgi:hypothetical protein